MFDDGIKIYKFDIKNIVQLEIGDYTEFIEQNVKM